MPWWDINMWSKNSNFKIQNLIILLLSSFYKFATEFPSGSALFCSTVAFHLYRMKISPTSEYNQTQQAHSNNSLSIKWICLSKRPTFLSFNPFYIYNKLKSSCFSKFILVLKKYPFLLYLISEKGDAKEGNKKKDNTQALNMSSLMWFSLSYCHIIIAIKYKF